MQPDEPLGRPQTGGKGEGYVGSGLPGNARPTPEVEDLSAFYGLSEAERKAIIFEGVEKVIGRVEPVRHRKSP